MKKIDNIVEATSIAYYLAYRCLMRENQKCANYYNESISIYFFPAITIAAFSCEIALKNHLRKVGITKKGHDLRKLFEALPTLTQDKYASATIDLENRMSTILKKQRIFDRADFGTALDRCKLSYTNCRYLYEGPQTIDIDFIEAFMFALNDETDEYDSFLKCKIGKQ